MNQLLTKPNQTPIEIALGIDENGMTTAKRLYDFLELNPSNYSKWVKRNILENEFAEIDNDFYSYQGTNEGRGNFAEDFKLTSEFAKKLSMTAKNDRGEQARDYFVKAEGKLKSLAVTLEGLSTEMQALIMQDKKIQYILEHASQTDDRMDKLENEVPLFNIECDELQSLVKKIGTRCLGGYNSPAYKDNSLRTKVYKDIQNQLKREFGLERSYKALKRKQLDKAKEIIEAYELPFVLYEEVLDANHQLTLMLKEDK